MISKSTKRTLAVALVCSLAVVGMNGPVYAAHGGGGHCGGGGHFAGSGHFGGGGYRGGYRSHGGYGSRGGYGWRGGYGGWGWAGVGLGLYFATLPFYYSTFWADGVPYYYSDDTYYQWDSNVGQYETVNPPADVQHQRAAQSPNLIAYPKNGQSEAQQATDKSQCQTWAAAQSGFDPVQTVATDTTTSEYANKRSQYERAQSACFEGRGYSVN